MWFDCTEPSLRTSGVLYTEHYTPILWRLMRGREEKLKFDEYTKVEK